MSKENIIKFAGDEYDIQAQQIKDLPSFTTPIQEKIDDLIAPAAKYDQKIAELTVAINQKMYEIDVKSTDIINCGCATTVGIGTSSVAVGTTSYYERVQAPRQDSEDPSFTGVNPYATDNLGTANLTTGIGSDTAVASTLLGVGVDTNIVTLSGIGNSIFTVDVNTSGVSTCPGKTCAELDAELNVLTGELAELKAERVGVGTFGVEIIKSELKVQYVRRHSYNTAKANTQKRADALKKLKDLASDPTNKSYFD